MNNFSQGRIIGIRHRVKKTAEGEARPTELSIFVGDSTLKLSLETEGDELSFVREGLLENDRIAMILGGSGDSLAYALSRNGEGKGVKVYRIPAYLLKRERGKDSKDDDQTLLAELLRDKREIFYEIRSRDRALIEVTECFRMRTDTMKARIACEQRLRTNFIGKTFRRPDGLYPEGMIEDLFDAEKANSVILKTLEKEESSANRDLEKALGVLDVYTEIFENIEGCGPAIAAGIIASISDIRRFETVAKFKAFLGVHVMDDGKFARRRSGQLNNWNPAGRQALYHFGDQMNRRPKSEWGIKQRQYKEFFRSKHPEAVTEGGKKRYTPGHINKMATWRTITKFAEWLYREWWKLETRSSEKKSLAA